MKDIAVDPETVSLWLVDHSFDPAKKTLCCLNWNLYLLYDKLYCNELVPTKK